MANQTLADFARALGIPPVTARSWKHRGRIVRDERGNWFWLRCSTCGQLYSGDGGACHVYCSEECAGGREDNCAACRRGKLKPCGCRGMEFCDDCRPPVKVRQEACAGCADLRVGLVATQADIASLVAENTELRDLVAKVEADIRYLRTRIGEPAPDLATVTLSAADQAAALIASHRRA